MKIEEYMKLSNREQAEYLSTLSHEQKRQLIDDLRRYNFKQTFTATMDDILALCEETKEKYHCSSECAAQLVGMALQKMQLDELEALEVNTAPA